MENKKQFIATKIKEVLEDREWNYEFNEDKLIFEFELRIPSPVRRLDYTIFVKEEGINVVARLPIGVDIENRKQIINMEDYLHSINFGEEKSGIKYNTFNGDIVSKTFVDCEGIFPSTAMINNAINSTAGMVIIYGDGIMGIIFSNFTSRKALECIERKLEVDNVGKLN